MKLKINVKTHSVFRVNPQDTIRLCVVCASPPKEAPLTHPRAACGVGRIGRIQNRNVLEEDEVED